jgi:hypothetical protein
MNSDPILENWMCYLKTWPSFLLRHKLKFSFKNYGYGPIKERKKERKCNNLMIARILKLTAAYNTECIRAQKMLSFCTFQITKEERA